VPLRSRGGCEVRHAAPARQAPPGRALGRCPRTSPAIRAVGSRRRARC